MLSFMGDAHGRGVGDHDDRAATDQAGQDRDRTAQDRDLRADAHDEQSEGRDARAQERDERAEARELAADGIDIAAAADRAAALRDRRGGASDRTQAADDRDAASADRILSAADRATSSIDELTGTYRREAGVGALEREIARATRTKQPFALAFVDVDDLKATNDSRGHAAGDQRLRETADSIRAHVRSDDVIVRFGGDEFLCGLLDVTIEEAAKRFSLVNAELAATGRASVSVGLAQFEAGDALQDLIARADDALYTHRRRPPSTDDRPRFRRDSC